MKNFDYQYLKKETAKNLFVYFRSQGTAVVTAAMGCSMSTPTPSQTLLLYIAFLFFLASLIQSPPIVYFSLSLLLIY